MAMTRIEAEAQVRTVARHCMGPCVVPDVTQRETLATLEQEMNDGRWAEAFGWVMKLESAAALPAATAFPPTPVGDWGALRMRVLRVVRRRAGCGADFNELVCAGPLDGEEHGYECPRCHSTGTYRAPRFEVESV